MEIFFDDLDSFYNDENKILQRCVSIINNGIKYHYEFNIRNIHEALINCDSILHIMKAIEFFRTENMQVDIFYNEGRTFYKAYDRVQSFKLPINCLQPTTLFLNEDYLDSIEDILDYDEVYVSVAIINDEYVLLNKHEQVYSMNQNYINLVNVYIANYNEVINDIIYIAKENNINRINKIPKLKGDEYILFKNNFNDAFNLDH